MKQMIAAILGVAALLALFSGDLIRKTSAQHHANSVAIAYDWNDLKIFADRERRPIDVVISLVQKSPVQMIALEDDASSEDEEAIRQGGWRILWIVNRREHLELLRFVNRLQKGDGLLSFEREAVGYPAHLSDVREIIAAKDLFLPIVEFAPQKGLGRLIQGRYEETVKAHHLHREELLDFDPHLWTARLVRAVRERWVRLLLIDLSPALTLEENLEFHAETATQLRELGYEFKPFESTKIWPLVPVPTKARWLLALFIGTMAPLSLLLLVRAFNLSAPIPTFLLATFISVVAGTLVHAVGAIPPWTVGGAQISGIKLQLLLPMLLALPLIFENEFQKNILDRPITGRILLLVGGGVFVLGGLYLMRSGNHPLLPVSEFERHVRDLLEKIFSTRPRFKEFALGHPLFILGLFIKQDVLKDPRKDWAWRILLWFGVVGQISIVNTFFHFHTPYDLCLLKTIHGLWIGALISLPLCIFYAAFKNKIFAPAKDLWPPRLRR